MCLDGEWHSTMTGNAKVERRRQRQELAGESLCHLLKWLSDEENLFIMAEAELETSTVSTETVDKLQYWNDRSTSTDS